MQDILKFVPKTMLILIPILVGYGFILKDTKPSKEDNLLAKIFKCKNWLIPYYLIVIGWINAFAIQFYPDKMQWFVVGQLVAMFSKYGYDLVIKQTQK